jgi:hypothetical protein
MCTDAREARLLNDADSAKRFEKTRDEPVEIWVGSTERFDFLDGVNDRRMVLSPEAASDLRE